MHFAKKSVSVFAFPLVRNFLNLHGIYQDRQNVEYFLNDMGKLKYAAQDIFCAVHSVETSWTFSILNAGCAAGNHLEKETVAGVEPTCFAPGFSSEIICAACAETLRESVALALTEHSYEWYRFIARKPYRKQ